MLLSVHMDRQPPPFAADPSPILRTSSPGFLRGGLLPGCGAARASLAGASQRNLRCVVPSASVARSAGGPSGVRQPPSMTRWRFPAPVLLHLHRSRSTQIPVPRSSSSPKSSSAGGVGRHGSPPSTRSTTRANPFLQSPSPTNHQQCGGRRARAVQSNGRVRSPRPSVALRPASSTRWSSHVMCSLKSTASSTPVTSSSTSQSVTQPAGHSRSRASSVRRQNYSSAGPAISSQAACSPAQFDVRATTLLTQASHSPSSTAGRTLRSIGTRCAQSPAPSPPTAPTLTSPKVPAY